MVEPSGRSNSLVAKLAGVASVAGCQKRLDRLPFRVGQNMDLQPVEKTPLAGRVVSKLLLTVESATVNADVVADGDWEAVYQENALLASALPVASQPLENSEAPRS